MVNLAPETSASDPASRDDPAQSHRLTTARVSWKTSVQHWFDSYAGPSADTSPEANAIDWVRMLPFLGMHGACLAVFWVGWSWTALWVALVFYAIRMFAITGFYHRYFSHRAFRTSRVAQFLFAMLGTTSLQRGPLWWASHHRHHHAHADDDQDAHSPVRHGFLWSHVGWFMCRRNFRTRLELVPDWSRFPELRFLDRFDITGGVLLAVSLFIAGEILARRLPQLGTDGWQLLVWGFFVSTVVLYHVTFAVNSVAHSFGRRRYATRDASRNNAWLALLTFGEGWHNNHHHYPRSVRQGFYWWEIDLTYYLLRGLACLGIVWDLKPVPLDIRDRGRIDREAPSDGGRL